MKQVSFKSVLASLIIFGVAAAYVLFMAATQSFGVKCSRAYESNTAAHERCVARLSNGGPVFEENIGKI